MIAEDAQGVAGRCWQRAAGGAEGNIGDVNLNNSEGLNDLAINLNEVGSADDTMSAAGDDLNNNVINVNNGARAQLGEAPGASDGRVEGKIRPATGIESGHVHYNSLGTGTTGSVACAGRREGLDVHHLLHAVGSADHPVINVYNSNHNIINFNNLARAPSEDAGGLR